MGGLRVFQWWLFPCAIMIFFGVVIEVTGWKWLVRSNIVGGVQNSAWRMAHQVVVAAG